MKLLVANRGEVAIRILNAARDLSIETVAIYALDEDTAHVSYADIAVKLQGDGSSFMDIDQIVNVAKSNGVTHIHPGYGFLSESSEFSKKIQSNGMHFIGPKTDVLEISGNKVTCRNEAQKSQQPVVPGTKVNNLEDINSFVRQQKLPIILKAVDGGGGRGVRIVRNENEIASSWERCRGESPSGQVFVERALVDGWKHVEVQIAGDASGAVIDLGDRECSVQRRFQKIVEVAPSTLPTTLSRTIIDAAKHFARDLGYTFLGTFEYLVNPRTFEFFFMEVNPRLQVEHTVTEEVTGVDLVALQLLLAQGATLEQLHLVEEGKKDESIRTIGTAIQCRITSEKVDKDFALSLGKISNVYFPTGPKIRIDSWIYTKTCTLTNPIITPYFDSLLAKVITHAPSLELCTNRAIRALEETQIDGISTNIDLLIAILKQQDWKQGNVDTLWLEAKLAELIEQTKSISQERQERLKELQHQSNSAKGSNDSSNSGSSGASGTVLIAPNTTFDVRWSTADKKSQTASYTINTISRNQIPFELSGQASQAGSSSAIDFTISQRSGAGSSSAEMGDPGNPTHVISPTGGKVVSLSPKLTAGTRIEKGEELVVVSVMKMETVVRAEKSGTIQRVGGGIEMGEIISEGSLVCQWDEEHKSKL